MKRKNLFAVLMIVCGASSFIWANIYSNGGFESNGSGWVLQVTKTEDDSGAKANWEFDTIGAKEGKKFCRIIVDSTSIDPIGNNWYIQLQDPTWTSKKNMRYTFTIWAKADSAGRPIHIAAQGDKDDKYKYRTGLNDTLTTEWAQYTHTFLDTDVAGNGQLSFFVYCGGSKGKYDFDGAVLDSVAYTVGAQFMPIITGRKQALPYQVQLLPDCVRFIMSDTKSPSDLRMYSVEGRLISSMTIPATIKAFDLPRPAPGTWIMKLNSESKMIQVP